MKKAKWKQCMASVLAGVLVFSNIPAAAFAQTPVTTVETSTETIYESKLPVVYINTENNAPIVSKDEYLNATMKIQGNDTYSDSDFLYEGEIEISGRGNSTWNMPKKPYKIKLDKKSDLFGMGKHKRWVLLANYSDESLMRNTLAYNLSGQMGMPQMETVWVDVVLNGEYVGNYQFCEQIKIDDDNRVDIFDWESFAEDAAEIIAETEKLSEDEAGDLEDYMKEENMSWITEGIVTFHDTTYQISDYPEIEVPSISGGYLMELDEYYDEVSKFKTYSNQPIMFKNPEFVSTNKDMMNYIQTYIQSFEDAVQSEDYMAAYENTTKHYSELFDFNSLVDYWLINEIFFNEELNKKSTYMYKDIDGLVYMGPIWDMDYSSGGEGDTYITNQWATTYFNKNAQANMWYKDLVKDPYFVLKAQERYWEIRNTLVQDMLDSIDTGYDLLKESADANADIWYDKHNFDSEVNSLKEWFNTHLDWLDEQMRSEDSVLTSLGYKTGNLTLSATDIHGAALPKDTLSDKTAADVAVNVGESIVLRADSTASSNGNADVFVNGKKIGSVQLGSDITITSDQLTSDYNTKNIIEVKLYDNSTVKNYITVLETDISQLPPAEPDTPETPDTTDPEFDGRDYPTSAMTAIADSQYKETPNEGPARYVLDGNKDTHWHTNWDTTEGMDVANRWVGVELAETITIDGIRCLPRQGKTSNGMVIEYEIQYRMTDSEEWKTAATGSWDEYDTSWKQVSFAPVEAKYVRIVGVATMADNEYEYNAHMSLAEFRVQRAASDSENAKTVTSIALAKAADKTSYAVGEAFEPKGLTLTVTYSDGTSAAIAYNAVGVTLVPAAGTKLTESDKIVTITYAGKTATMDITVEAKDSTEPIYESKLPVVYINTENNAPIVSKDEYLNATMKIQGNDTYSDSDLLYEGEIEISGRGNSTWNMPKKPYKIKLDKKSNLFGMGKHKRWVLLANYSDESLMRNTLAYNLSGQMGMPQMETVWVDVVLNGEYVGNYQFCEQIKLDENNRIDIFDWESFAEDAAEIIASAENLSDDAAGDLEDYMKEENMSWITSGEVTFDKNVYKISDHKEIEVPAITGGYLMELDEYYDEVSKFRTNSDQPIMFKNPEFVSTNQDMMNYIQTYIQSFEDAVQSSDYTAQYEGKTTHYSELFDFNSLVDYWLISEIFFNEELNKKSTYMYKDIDGLVYMGPIWDMDYSSGGEGQTYRTNEWATTFFNTNAQANMWYKDLIKDPYFILKAQERYWEIRNTLVQEMVDSIDSSYELLKESADANADIWYGEHNFDSEVNSLKEWFNTHLDWLDEQMGSETSILTSLGYQTSELTLSLTDSNGSALPKDTLSTAATASAVIEDGAALRLQVSGSNLSGSADVYVNSRKTGTVAIGSEITISAEQLSAVAGEKDIIEVKVSDSKNGSILAQNCTTVLEKEKPRTDLSEEDVTLDANSFTYDGTEKVPQITVASNGTILTKDTDYTVSINNNIEVGTATITITGIGNYQGTIIKTFEITPAQSKPEDTEKPEDNQKPESTPVTKEALKGIITTVESLKPTDYTSASYQAVQTALSLAKTINAKADATQAEVDIAKTLLDIAVQALVKPTVTPQITKTALVTAISAAETTLKTGTYTNASYQAVQKALDTAKTVNAKADATQAEVDIAKMLLDIAVQALVKPTVTPQTTKTALVTAISAAEAALKAGEYTTASYQAVKKALNTAKTVNAKADATQAEVDIAKAVLDTTVNGLIKAEPPKTPEDHSSLVGNMFTVKGAIYKITKVNETTGEAAFLMPKTTAKRVTIPATVTYEGITLKVTSIAKNAFKKNTKVTKVVIGSNVTTIGTSAFEGCSKLTNLTIGKNVTKIGDKAFKGCKALKKVTIPAKITAIGKEAFQNCSKLVTITIQTTKLKTVGKNAFKGIKSNATIKVPAKKITAYKKLLKNKGQNKKVKITK